jgi:saccharopine dehydrogenase (NAD+, L-lysine-forming)
MLFKKVIYLRSESNRNEKRTPITPVDCSKLSKNGFLIYVQKSPHRIYSDQDYEENGVIITDLPWYDPIFQHSLIVGLKEFPELDRLAGHSHLFFSHSFKKQANSRAILSAFQTTESKIYDFEYITNEKQKRLLAFGEYSGFVGAALGLLFYEHSFLPTLSPWASYEEMISSIPIAKSLDSKIAVIGPNGRCGTGVCKILNYFSIPFTPILKETDKSRLTEFDIVYNCILLDPGFKEAWLTPSTEFSKRVLLVDVSCDPTKPNNPFPIYSEATSWNKPVYTIQNKHLDVIAIDNMPSLLPRESSDYFSSLLTKILLTDDTPIYRSIDSFTNAIKEQEPAFYVINFNDDARRERMASRFSKIGLKEPHFVDPVFISDPRLDNDEIQHKRTCSIMLQHLDSLKHFLEQTDKEFCIVCEDDIHISKNLRNDLPEIIEQFKTLDLDVLLLGYLSMYPVDTETNAHFALRSRSKKYEYANFPDDLWGSQMYMMSRKHAKLVLDKFGPDYILTGELPYNPDWILTKMGNRALIVPMLAVEEGDTKTDHGGQNEFHRRCFECNYDPLVHI